MIDVDDLFPEPPTPPPQVDRSTGEVIRPGISVETAILRLGRLLPEVGGVLAGIAGYPVETASPEERADLLRLHEHLELLIEVAKVRADAIEIAFRRGMAELGANEIVLPDGRKVTIERPKAAWSVKGDTLRQALTELLPKGGITKQEIDDAVRVEVSYRADNRKLNYLAEHRGEAVAEAIEANRERVTPSTLAGIVRWPR